MNAVRIPTPAQNDVIRRDHARRYAEVQSMRPDVAAAGMAFCDAANDEAELRWPVVIGCVIAGLGMWAAVGYATWWAVGFFFGANP